MKVFRKNTRVLFMLVIPVYLFIIQSSTQNRHTHFFANGLGITHSHPLDKDLDSPIKNHSHSKNEIYLLSLLNIDFHTSTPECVINFIDSEYCETYIIPNIQKQFSSPIFQVVQRGPPSYIS